MPPKLPSKSNPYSAKNIVALSPREHIRLRPGMYIGGTNVRALHHMMYEVLDNAVEEVMIGKCNRITVTLRANQTVTVEDNSEGLPVEDTYHPRRDTWKSNGESDKASYLELIMTDFVHKPRYEDKYYGVTGGLHGVGLHVVNTLSKVCSVQVRRDGFLWEQSYEEGLPITKVRRVCELRDDEATGNTITFQPDFAVINKNDFDFQIVATRCKDLAYLFPDVTTCVRDLRGKYLVERTYHFPDGISALVTELNAEKQVIHPTIKADYIQQIFDRHDTPMDIGVSLAFQFHNDTGITIKSYVNTVPTPYSGVHSEALIEGVIDSIKNAGHPQFRIGQARLGFTGVIHVQHPDPQFASPTKTNLMNPEVKIIVAEAIQHAIDTQPQAFDTLIESITAN